MILHGAHPFPPEMEDLLQRIDALGRQAGRWPLGENWPYSPREFDWEQGKGLKEGLRPLVHLEAMFRAGRGDEVLLNPVTQKPLKTK